MTLAGWRGARTRQTFGINGTAAGRGFASRAARWRAARPGSRRSFLPPAVPAAESPVGSRRFAMDGSRSGHETSRDSSLGPWDRLADRRSGAPACPNPGEALLILRPICRNDLEPLVALASLLDSVNLPSDREFLAARIESSLRSFAGGLEDRRLGVYVFVLEDAAAGRVIGTSTILAKHGTPGRPFYWLEVYTEERHSIELDRRFEHRKLRLRSTEDGATEIGGLILEPDYRRDPRKCGKALSIVRFAYISAHPDRFERDVMAEMLSPFEASGTNLLWEAFGARFTGLGYREADRLSVRSKSFIADLFPRDPVYTTLFPPQVQAVIGEPGEMALPAVRILEKVGFRYLHQVDPFDGGPYYGAARDVIASVRERRELVLPSLSAEVEPLAEGPLALVSAEAALGFRASVVPLDPRGTPAVSREVREALGVKSGDAVAVTPLP